jgi:hypothetical protein
MDGMQTEQAKAIAPKYLALVERYKAEPFKSIKRVKMMMDFICWFRNHLDSLTDDEKEYLQTNICTVNTDIPKYTY